METTTTVRDARTVPARTAATAAAAAAALLLAGCGAGAPVETPAPTVAAVVEGEYLITETIAAPSLANNMLGDPAEREVLVLLPPSYYTTDARYPVVYFLAGYTQRIGTFVQHRSEVWEQMQADGMQEFIIVEVDGINSVGGNFYTNSPVTGNAEDFLIKDLVAHVDGTYRTVPEASARGLSGFSMGGSGTINVGLRNPDVYAALYAHSPGLLHEDGGLEGFLRSNGNWSAYGAAFVWDLEAEEPYFRPIDAHAPLEDQDPELVAAWEAGFGNLRGKIADYLAQPDRLVEIRVAAGTTDMYRWIPVGSEYFVGLLEENGIPGSFRSYVGGHNVDYEFFASDCVEFFSRTLAG